MDITRLSQPIKSLFSHSSINQIARDTGFISRLRGMRPLSLVAALCHVLGTKREANLADIHRQLKALSPTTPDYKPFHNQLKKEKLTAFMKRLTALVTEQLLVKPFIQTLPENLPFERIHVHDGSTLKLHDGLKKTFPGRFTRTMPAAIELHLTMDLLSGGVDYMAIDADKESERLYQPYANESKGTLHLLDAGYFEIEYVSQLRLHGAHCIMPAKSNINPTIVEAIGADGKKRTSLHGKPLQSLKLKKGDIVDLKVTWEGHRGSFRIIASWCKRKQRRRFLITTLSRQCANAALILQYYSLRWQVELLFKEMKSYCSLSTFATQDANIVQTLVWSSTLVMLIKRYAAFSVAALYQIPISTQKVQRSAVTWMHYLVQGLCGKIPLDTALEQVATFLEQNARRAHPKRDEGSLAMLLDLFTARFREPELVKIQP